MGAVAPPREDAHIRVWGSGVTGSGVGVVARGVADGVHDIWWLAT